LVSACLKIERFETDIQAKTIRTGSMLRYLPEAMKAPAFSLSLHCDIASHINYMLKVTSNENKMMLNVKQTKNFKAHATQLSTFNFSAAKAGNSVETCHIFYIKNNSTLPCRQLSFELKIKKLKNTETSKIFLGNLREQIRPSTANTTSQ
jgi:hypothetical protein